MGLEVFLDVDNLGQVSFLLPVGKELVFIDWCWQGAFDQQLWKTMGGAKNVLLVWTKGCMDRFLDESDPTNQGDKHLWREHDYQLTCIPQILFERNTL
jgi:hypothetical protein